MLTMNLEFRIGNNSSGTHLQAFTQVCDDYGVDIHKKLFKKRIITSSNRLHEAGRR